MDAIIDDSPKATRTAHRVLVAASAATMVFALSLQAPAAKVALRDTLESMLTFRFHDYDEDVAAKLSKFESVHLKSIQEGVAQGLASKRGLIFGVERIAEAMGKAMVLKPFVLNDTKLGAPGEATLEQLDAFDRSFDLHEDAEVILPSVPEVVQAVGAFLEENGGTGLAVESVRVEAAPGEVDVANNTATFQMYFELRSPGPHQSTPVFAGEFRAPVRAVEGTAFKSWLASNEQAKEFVGTDGPTLRWLPGFRNNPEAIRRGDQSMPMKALLDRTSAEIDDQGPGKQVVSFLGTSVPGQLVAFASPLVLLLLSYSLHNHIAHLYKLKREVYADLERFAWMPVSMPLFHGVLEFWSSAIILPLLSLVLLQAKLWGEHDFRVIRLVSITFGMVGVLVIGLRAVRKLTMLRKP